MVSGRSNSLSISNHLSSFNPRFSGIIAMDLIDIIKALFSLVPNLLALPKEQRERKDAALRSIVIALDETYLYYRDQSKRYERNLDREAQLAKYWSAAAIPMRHVDLELAERCDCKAEYWLNPEIQTNESIENLNISLNSVRAAYRSLIRPTYFSARAKSSSNVQR